MLERGDALATWRLDADPTRPGALPVSARRIGDHRTAYLDYEGPIGRDRGEVTRVDRGRLEVKELTASRWVLDLRGRRMTGRFVLAVDAGAWTLCLDADG